MIPKIHFNNYVNKKDILNTYDPLVTAFVHTESFNNEDKILVDFNTIVINPSNNLDLKPFDILDNVEFKHRILGLGCGNVSLRDFIWAEKDVKNTVVTTTDTFNPLFISTKITDSIVLSSDSELSVYIWDCEIKNSLFLGFDNVYFIYKDPSYYLKDYLQL